MTLDQQCVIGVALAVALMLPTVAEAQQQNWEFAIGAGPTFPLAELADEVETGFNVMGSAGYYPSFLPFGVRADFFLQSFDAVERAPSIHRTLGGEWYRQLSGMVNAKYRFPGGRIQPYALLGAGWIREWHDDRTYWSDSQSTVNFNAGLGIDFSILRLDGFVEGRYLNLFGGEALSTRLPAVHPEVQFKSIPITVGVRF